MAWMIILFALAVYISYRNAMDSAQYEFVDQLWQTYGQFGSTPISKLRNKKDVVKAVNRIVKDGAKWNDITFLSYIGYKVKPPKPIVAKQIKAAIRRNRKGKRI